MSPIRSSGLVFTNLVRATALLVATLPLGALAIGLGAPIGNPVLGQALRIEIPLSMVPGEKAPATECVRITLPPDTPDRQFFPRNARVSIDSSRPGAARVVILSPLPLTEPLIEFRLIVGCQNELAKDFLILTQAAEANNAVTTVGTSRGPTAAASPPPVVTATAEPTLRTPAPSAMPASAVPADNFAEAFTLRLSRDTTLNAMARARYPRTLATRDEYRRLMGLANPQLFDGKSQIGSILLPAGTVLYIPPNLPPPEAIESARAAKPPANESDSVANKPVTPASSRQKADPATTADPKDRLVVGGGGLSAARPLNPRELSSAIERMERMIEDQGRTEVALSENIQTLTAAFLEVKEYMVALDAKTRKLEAEQKLALAREQARPEPKSLGVLEMLALILTSGAVGAGLLALQYRFKRGREERNEHMLTSESDLDIEAFPEIRQPDAAEPGEIPVRAQPVEQRDMSFSVSPAANAVSPAPTIPSAPTITVPSVKAKPAAPVIPDLSGPAPSATSTTSLKAPAVAATTTAATGNVGEIPAQAIAPSQNTTMDPVTLASASPPTNAPKAPPPTATAAITGLEPRSTPPPELEEPLEFMLPSLDDPVVNLPTMDTLSDSQPEAVPAPAMATMQVMETPDANESDQDAAIELAGIMESMGLAKEAARTLVEHIYLNPKRDLGPWLKALTIYRKTGQREEFDTLAQNLRQHLNVQPNSWEEFNQAPAAHSLLEYRHLVERVQRTWRTPECDEFLVELMSDNRQGTRAGFPQEVAEEILLLQRILRDKG